MKAAATLEPTTATPALATELKSVGLEAVRALVLFGTATLAHLALLAALFALGVFGGIDILFYRCIAVSAVAAIVFAIALILVSRRTSWLTLRDAAAVTMVAASLNFTFLTLGPVTVDRSISIFINGHMTAEPDRVFTAAEIDRAFRDRYLTGMDQIARRMEEQRATGTVERIGDGYRITAKGKALIANSRLMAALFGADHRLLDGAKPSR